MNLTYKFDIDCIKVYHRIEYLGQRSFRSKIITGPPNMGQYCFARWRLSSVVAGRVGGRAADPAQRASTVTFR